MKSVQLWTNTIEHDCPTYIKATQDGNHVEITLVDENGNHKLYLASITTEGIYRHSGIADSDGVKTEDSRIRDRR